MSIGSSYQEQHRGSQSDYDHYFASMDKTMQQKLAFTAAHFLLRPGATIADMGSGSGFGSYQFALLNPHVNVVGIDINSETVRLASERYKLPNLRFEVGDIEKPDPALGPFDGALNSSVLHHVLSFNGYDATRVKNALKNQFACMRLGGMNVIRDFCAWPHDKFVLLDVSTAGKGSTPQGMSDADLLQLFSETARPLTPEFGKGFFLEEVPGASMGFQRFRLSAKWANEFLLRKDYRESWNTEILEEYSWWTPHDYRRELSTLDARVVYTAPFWNSWIIDNRYRGKVWLWREDETPLNFPPTNFIAVAEKISPETSLHVSEHTTSSKPKTYLAMSSLRNTKTHEIYDMASRPGEVTDCLPYMWENGRLYVYAKHGYPRPLANIVPRGTPNLDGKYWSGHMVEPIAVVNPGFDFGEQLANRSGLKISDFSEIVPGLAYYPSPGMIDEKVNSVFIPVANASISAATDHERSIAASVSGLSTSGEVRLYPAQDLLRTSQVGLLPEARLELNIYALMRHLGVKPDKWLGGDVSHPKSTISEVHTLEQLLSQPAEKAYEATDKNAGYLKNIRSIFADQAKDRRLLATGEYEFVLPAKASANVAVTIPVALDSNGEICIGLEQRDLPAPQNREGNSHLFVAPAYRLPYSISSSEKASDHIKSIYGDGCQHVVKLGEGYFSSIGITPERAFPFLAHVDPANLKHPLHFVRLRDVFDNLDKLRDAHLIVGALRATHALDIWPEPTIKARLEAFSVQSRPLPS